MRAAFLAYMPLFRLHRRNRLRHRPPGPPGAKRFDELKVGDKVSITYNNTVSARLKPPGEARSIRSPAPPPRGRGSDLAARRPSRE